MTLKNNSNGDGHPGSFLGDAGARPTNHQGSNAEDSPEAIVRRENRAVFLIRIVVLLVLLAAATATAVIVYIVTSEAEENAFLAEFDGIATKVSKEKRDLRVLFPKLTPRSQCTW